MDYTVCRDCGDNGPPSLVYGVIAPYICDNCQQVRADEEYQREVLGEDSPDAYTVFNGELRPAD